MTQCTLDLFLPLTAANAGLFISPGHGRHPSRRVSFFVLIFVRSGVLGIQEEQTEFTVKAGQSLLLWPDRHHFGTVDYPHDLEFYWIHFEIHPTPSNSTHSIDIPQHAVIRRPDQLTEVFRRYLDDQQSGVSMPGTDTYQFRNPIIGEGSPSDQGRQLPSMDQPDLRTPIIREGSRATGGEKLPVNADLLVLLILNEVAMSPPAGIDHNVDRSTATAQTAVLAERARVYIRSHFHEDISASTVASAVGCNPNYLARVYRTAHGHTVTDAIHHARMKTARRLLIAGHHNVAEISRLCGFDDDGYFRRLFKRTHGMTPVSFSRLYARVHVNTS